jgi:hypothetical protein
MENNDLDHRFMARLRAEGLTDQEIRILLLAPDTLKLFHFMVTEMQVYSEHAKPHVLEQADLAGMS